MKDIPEKCCLHPPEGIEPIETELATIWEEEGIVYSKAKKRKRNLENLELYFDAVRKLTGGKKAYFINDLNEMQTYSSEEKDYLHRQLIKNCEAIAVLSCKPLGKMMATIAILKKIPSYPAQMFEDLSLAKAWINELRSKNNSGD